jgi:hypothetical protein
MKFGELGPTNGQHLARGIELHGARSQGDHGCREGKVLRLEPPDIAQELRFGVMRVKDGMS